MLPKIKLKLQKLKIWFQLKRQFKSTNLKNVFFFPFYHTGGAEKVHLDIVKSVGNKKSNLVFFTDKSINKHYWNSFNSNANCIEISQVYQNSYLRTYFIECLNELVKSNEMQYVFFGCNNYLFYQVVLNLHTKKNIKFIDLIHAFSKPDKGIEDESIKYVKYLFKRITISKKTRVDLMNQYQSKSLEFVELDKIEIIPNGLELPTEPRIRNSIQTVIFLGRDSQEKNFPLFVEIAKRCPKINFVALGPSKQENYPTNLKCLGLIHNTKIKDFWLKKADALVVASHREGFPVAIMEAMANGLVVLSSNVGAISESILNKENGYLIDYSSNDQMLIEFCEILRKQNENELTYISKNAIAHSKKYFDLNLFQKKYRAIFSN